MRDILYVVSRWILLLFIVFLACYLFYAQIYLVYGPRVADVDARLPTLFHSSAWAFWTWFVGLAALAGGLGGWIVRSLRAARSGRVADPDGSDEADAELASACAAIANLWSGHEQDPAYLIIAEGEAPLALLSAAGLAPDAIAPPDDPDPLRGLRTADGLFLQCAGPATRGVRAACELLPTLAGSPAFHAIIVQIHVATLISPRSQGWGHASRALLREVADRSATRCPVYVVVSGMEDVPGFLEFAHRSPPEYRTSARFGFTIPGTDAAASPLVAGEYDRLIAWYNLAMLDFMEVGPLLQAENEALFALGHWFGRYRDSILQFLEAARPGGADALELSNCYFVASGANPDQRAFVEGLMRIKVAGDARSIRWSSRALAADRTLRRVAVGLGVGGGLLAGLAWAAIFALLRPTGWLDPLLALAIAVGWGAGWYELVRGFRRGRAASV